MAAKKKSKKKGAITVRLQSTASAHFYTTKKNPRMEGGPSKNGKLTGLIKFDPFVRKHVPYDEKKVGK